jgi:hypothetical protein
VCQFHSRKPADGYPPGISRHQNLKLTHCLILAVVFYSAASAPADTAPEPGLKQQCDILVQKALVRSYGIAWPGGQPTNDRAPLVSYAPGGTPAAGWVLWEAGRIFHEPRFTRAAIDVARALANCQEAGGKIPDTVRFGLQDNRGQDPPHFVPDRQSTCAALALLLTILHDSPKPDARLRSCALLAARWLSRQETLHGAWPTRDETQAQDSRMIRLDNPDWRDSTMALFLAADILKNNTYAKQAQMSGQMLLDLHLPLTEATEAGCWTGAYSLAQSPREDIPDAPFALDTLATRYSLQTLLADAVCAGDVPALERVHVACKALRDLRDSQGTLLRYVPLGNATSQPILLSSPPDEELPEVMHVVEVLDLQGLSQFSRSIDAGGIGGANGIDEELARVLSGAGDDLFNADHPTLAQTAEQIRQAVAP